MAKKIKFLLLIICMGFFILPKQNLLATTLKDNCCAMEQKASGSCHNQQEEKPCHNSENHSCDSNCTHCSTCTIASITLPAFIEDYFQLNKKFEEEKKTFSYILPEYAAAAARIWQPPKIG